MREHTKKYIPFIFIGAVLTIVLLLMFSFSSDPIKEIPLVRVKKTNLTVEVKTVGQLDAVDSVVVSSEVKSDRGKIIYLIEDGSRVNKGDILAKLDPAPFEEEINKYSAALKEAEINIELNRQQEALDLEQAKNQVNNAEISYKLVELEANKLEKGSGSLELGKLEENVNKSNQELNKIREYIKDLEKLKEEGYDFPMEVTRAKEKEQELLKAYNVAKQQYDIYEKYVLPSMVKSTMLKLDEAKTKLQQVKKSLSFTQKQAQARTKKAEQQYESIKVLLKEAQSGLEKTVIRAPTSGLAVFYETFQGGEMRKPRIGDVVYQNRPILFIPNLTRMAVKTKVREIDLHKVSKGKPAVINIDAYPDITLHGQVESIGILAENSAGNISIGDKYFKISVSIKESDDRLRPGMTARVIILTDNTSKPVLNVPLQAIFEKENKCFCYVYRNKKYSMQEVVPGIQNEDFAEIKEGLLEDDYVTLIKPEVEENIQIHLLK